MILLASACTGAPLLEAKSIDVGATPVDLDPRKPYKTQVGALEYLAGFELHSSESSFGGLSGLSVSPDGQSLQAVSDQGNYFTARLTHDARGHLTSIDSWSVTPIFENGAYGDAESITVADDGTFFISFEGQHRILRFAPSNGEEITGLGEPVPVPKALADAPFNGGLEGITLLRDGTLMALTEYYENPDGSIKGWLIKNSVSRPISYEPRDGFLPTDLATLPNGDVLVLERKFSVTNTAARIRRLRLAELKPGEMLAGEEIAEIAHPLTVDNFEGLAVRTGPDGSTLLYVVSDDNFMPFQKTLLLQFRLLP